MKGKIDSNGFLRIYRGDANPDHYQHQYCPFQTFSMATQSFEVESRKPCGTWCPQFGERKWIDQVGNSYHKKPKQIDCLPYDEIKTTLEICHGKTLVFDEFKEEAT
jgi:hypothetical protein